MKIVFLGTNGWYNTALANTCSVLIDSRKAYVILDAGDGLYKLDRYCNEEKPTFLFLSHFHLDHITGLHILAKFSFPMGLSVGGPRGSRKRLKAFVNQPFSMPLKDLPYPVRILEFPRELGRLPVRVECLELLHSSLTLGYRIVLEDKVIAYCPDTGYCENALRLADRADLVIAECSFRTGVYYPEWPHLNPELSSRIARRAHAKRLVLTHFDPTQYKTRASREQAETEAKRTFARTVAARDGLVLEL
ncbi:MAG: ribonuclease Z [Thermodesulfobacteriota bacterium]